MVCFCNFLSEVLLNGNQLNFYASAEERLLHSVCNVIKCVFLYNVALICMEAVYPGIKQGQYNKMGFA